MYKRLGMIVKCPIRYGEVVPEELDKAIADGWNIDAVKIDSLNMEAHFKMVKEVSDDS